MLWAALSPFLWKKNKITSLYGLHLRASARLPEMAPPSKFRQKGNKNFNISLNLNILAFLATKLVLILFKQIARYLFGMIFWKKKFFSILKFCDQLLIHIKTKLFFSIKIVQKLKAKKIYYINWKALPENATQWWKYLRIPPFDAGRIAGWGHRQFI